MMSTTTYYPTFGQNSRTGELISTPGPIWSVNNTYPCKKCIHHGKSTIFKIIKPCTICAMDNGGKWGWDDNELGEEHLIDENGTLPGHCGVEDCLKRNKIGGYYTDDHSKTLNEQIVLGFAQYALYNHLKWKDILYPRERSEYYPSLKEYRVRYAPEDTSNIDEEGQIDQAWYWWKMIPCGVCLPERLITILEKMLVSFDDKQYEGCIPKTSQKLEGELSDDIWTDFFETYVEPVHVAHLFQMTILKLLGCDDEVEFNAVSLNSDDTLPEDIGAVDKKWMRETASHLNEDFQGLKYICYKKINYEVGEDDPGRTKTKVIKIFDRDMFGTYLEDVVDYDWPMCRPWYRRTDIWHPVPNIIEANGEDRRGHGWEKELWNPGLRCSILDHLKDEVYEYIAYGYTSFWEDVMSSTNEMLENDYENERSFNEYISNIDPSETEDYHSVTYVVNDEDDWPPSNWMEELDEWRPVSVARRLNFDDEEEYEEEYEPGEIEENTKPSSIKLTEIVEKLKDLQMFVDESVKDSIPEGVYLELVNKMLDVYKSAK